MKSYINVGDFFLKKYFKSYYVGDRERNVCIVFVNFIVESVSLLF